MIPSISSPVLTSLPMSNGFAPSKSYNMLAPGNPMRQSTETIARRHWSWAKSDRKLVSSCGRYFSAEGMANANDCYSGILLSHSFK